MSAIRRFGMRVALVTAVACLSVFGPPAVQAQTPAPADPERRLSILDAVELANDPAFVVFQVASDRCERFAKPTVGGLIGQRPRPVHRQIEMAAAVVELADLPLRRLVVLEDAAVGLVERFGERKGGSIGRLVSEVFNRYGQCQEFAE